MTGYTCKECGAPADVTDDGRILRSCDHAGTVLASMDAVAYGRGGLRERNRLFEFFRALGLRLMGGSR